MPNDLIRAIELDARDESESFSGMTIKTLSEIFLPQAVRQFEKRKRWDKISGVSGSCLQREFRV